MTIPNFTCSENRTSCGSNISRNTVLEMLVYGIGAETLVAFQAFPGLELSPSPLPPWTHSFSLLVPWPQLRPCHVVSMPLACARATVCPRSWGNATFPQGAIPGASFPGPLAEVIPSAFGCQCLGSTLLQQLPHLGATLLAFRLSLTLSLRTVIESYLSVCANQCPQHSGHEVRFVGIQIPQDFKYLFHFLLSKLDYN